MFGLMKRADRMAFCGSCKTIGVMYGQRARLLLNHDMVFLAELLMEKSNPPEWTAAHRSFNCMSMPKEHPEALQYAATAAMVLAHFQIEDQLADTRKRRWQLVKRFFSVSYRKAATRMRELGFPLEEMTDLLATQGTREARAWSIEDVAEPTARATEMIFAGGHAELGSIGRRFGSLVYLLDAWEDRVKDTKSGDFNALLVFPEVDGRAKILSLVESLEGDLSPQLAGRLRANVEERLGMRMRVLYGACRKSAKQRWRSAVAFARSMKEKERAGMLKGAAVLATVSVLAYLAPHHIRGAETWRQCFGLPMNLMAVGALFATVPVPEVPPPTPSKPGGSGTSSGSSGCCDACSGCGDCCDCCEGCSECGSCCDC